jgi:hypothetical protein
MYLVPAIEKWPEAALFNSFGASKEGWSKCNGEEQILKAASLLRELK